MAKSTPTTGFPLAVVVEGGVALAAVLLAWIFAVELRALFPASVEGWTGGILRGLAATLPMLLAFFWLAKSSRDSFVKLREQVESMVQELFPTPSLAQFALVALLAGVGEELLFRGFLQSLLARWTSPLLGLILGSLAFGAAHAVTRTYFALASIIGLFLGWLMLEYNDLVAPIVAHTVYDFVALIFIARSHARRPAHDRAAADDDSMDPGHPPND